MLGPIIRPLVVLFFAMTRPTSRALNVEFISVPCMLPFCVPRKYVWHCTPGECNLQFTATLVCTVLVFALGDWLVADQPPSVDEVRPKVVICGKEFFVTRHYPKDASGKLQYDKKLIEELDTKTTDVLCNMCKHNPPSAQPTNKDKKADFIYKRVFCDFI